MTGVFQAFSQTYNRPAIGLKSHETMEILKVDLTSNMTILYLSIENKIDGGTFCADKNIFVVYPDGTRIKLMKSEGIPQCPDSYKFKREGEKLNFTLIFPSLRPGTGWIDLVEECSDNCFWVYGLTLNNELNFKLDEAFKQASEGIPADNMLLFKNLLDNIDSKNFGIEGLLYINIINAAIEGGDRVNASTWYKKLISSGAPRLDQYIRYLNDQGIKY